MEWIADSPSFRQNSVSGDEEIFPDLRGCVSLQSRSPETFARSEVSVWATMSGLKKKSAFLKIWEEVVNPFEGYCSTEKSHMNRSFHASFSPN